MAHVVHLFTCYEMGSPMEMRSSVRALAGVGLAGDRNVRGEGFFSKTRPKVRDASLISQEAIDEANRELTELFTPAETRRNIVTKGVNLNDLVGRTFTVGSIRMRGTELCDPCKRPSQLSSKPGFKEAFAKRGGLRAEILTSGIITVGDEIVVEN